MPDLRAMLIAIGVGLAAAAFAILWFHWPLAIGAGAGILLGGLALTTTISIGPDVVAADEAWRRAAPDLVDQPAEPAQVPVSVGTEASPEARGHDLPSGD